MPSVFAFNCNISIRCKDKITIAYTTWDWFVNIGSVYFSLLIFGILIFINSILVNKISAFDFLFFEILFIFSHNLLSQNILLPFLKLIVFFINNFRLNFFEASYHIFSRSIVWWCLYWKHSFDCMFYGRYIYFRKLITALTS